MSDKAHTRKGDPLVSHDAAETVGVSRDKRAVLWALWHRRELLTDDGIYSNVVWSYHHAAGTQQSLRSRRAELMREGYVGVAVDADGMPIYGVTEHHRRCRYFWLTDKGEELAEMLFG